MKASSSSDKLTDGKLCTKKDLINWINSLLQINVRNIQELANGAAFCQLVDVISSGKVRLKKINWNAKLQHQNLANLKILSVAMMDSGLDKYFEATRIAQKKGQDILQLLQWFRRYCYNNNIPKNTYDAKNRRSSIEKPLELSKQNSKFLNEKFTVPEKICLKPELCHKKQLDVQETEQLRNCIRINKSIQRVAFDQRTSPNLKIEMIKGIIFKGRASQSIKKQINHHGGQEYQQHGPFSLAKSHTKTNQQIEGTNEVKLQQKQPNQNQQDSQSKSFMKQTGKQNSHKKTESIPKDSGSVVFSDKSSNFGIQRKLK